MVTTQVGYFVHNDYESEELRETPPETPDLTQPITRSLFGKCDNVFGSSLSLVPRLKPTLL